MAARLAGMLCAVFCLPAAAQAPEMPAEYRAAVSAAKARGVGLFIHDVAAGRASDELVRHKVRQRDKRVRGWLSELSGQEVVVTFVGEAGGVQAALYRVRVPMGPGTPGFEPLQPAVPLAGSELARWTARQNALAELGKREDLCSESYNSVVMSPDPAPDGLIHVYMLAATDKPGVIVAGGHFRYDYSADGTRLESQRAFTKSCFTVDPPDEKKGKPTGFILTHLLDPTPTEIHVYLSRLHDQGVYVATEYGAWGVINGDIELLEKRQKETRQDGN